MKILRKWFLAWMQRAQDENLNAEAIKYDSPKAKYSNSISVGYAMSKEDAPKRITFHITPAAGGVVVSINKYDQRTGQSAENLHVIHDDEDVATNIGHIVSMELLRS